MDVNVVASSSAGNAYFISDGCTTMLLDAGVACKRLQVACGFRLSGISGALITHEHGDHSKACKDLMRMGIDLYASAGTFKVLGLTGHRAHIVKSMNKLQIGTMSVLPFNVHHDAREPLGFYITSSAGERLLYFTDTFYIDYLFPAVDILIAECNHSTEAINESVSAWLIPIELKGRLHNSHMSLETLLELLKANDLSRLQKIYLIHLSDNNSREDQFKREVQKLTGAEVIVCR